MPKNARPDSLNQMQPAPSKNLPSAETGNEARASKIIADASILVDSHLSKTFGDVLHEAVVRDLDAAGREGARDEDRLVKVESQVHALSDAVIVIGTTSGDIDDAVRAVKDKM